MLICLTGAGTASAATVTNNNDAGPGSLRALIAAAGSGDTIDFHPSVTGTIALTSGQLNITQTLTITGPGAGILTISGSNVSRVFEVSAAGSLTISGLTISDGSSGPIESGGAISNLGGLDVSDCVLRDNTAGPAGGAIHNAGTLTVSNTSFINNDGGVFGGGINQGTGTLTVSDSSFTGNQAGEGGGILSSGGSVTVTRTTFDGNSASQGGGFQNNGGTDSITDSTFTNNSAYQGGGMMLLNGGAVTIERCTFSSNTATHTGGGIWGPNSGSLTISNSTVSNNTALYVGGLNVRDDTTISSCTIADNQATAPGSAGNIWVNGVGSTTIENTIVAGGTPVSCVVEAGAVYTSAGHNLDTGTTCGFTGPGDIQNGTAGLGALANNGGLTQTRKLLGNSHGNNGGNPSTCPAIDQRGVARPYGPACDIGAYEGLCGDGVPDPLEVCDDGNAINDDACDVNCTLPACGNHVVAPSEDCEDGNFANGDCCDPTCQFEASGSSCVGDTLCADRCDGAGSCASMIHSGCRSAGKAALLVKHPGGAKDKLVWKWLKGEETQLAELGTPAGTTAYALCIYAGTTATAAIEVPPSNSLWSPVGSKGLKYKDPNRSFDGVSKVLLKSGADGKAKALLKAKDVNLPDFPAGPWVLPVTAQLRNNANSVCFEGIYDSLDVTKNETTQFKAKAQ